MKLRTFRRLGAEAWTSLRRNALMTLASVGTVFITLLTLGLFILIISNVDAAAASLESQVEITAYLKADATAAAVEEGLARIQAMPDVRAAELVTKDEALARLKEQFGAEQGLLAAVEEMNPLRDSYQVKLAAPEQVSAVAAAVGAIDTVEEVKYKQDVVEKLLRVTKIIRLAGMILMGLLLFATILVISNTIRLTVFARRREVSIMKLVGATDWYIRWPFLVEGMLIGLLGALGSAAVLYFGYTAAVNAWQESVPFLPLLTPLRSAGTTGGWLLVVGAAVGIAGSTLSLRRYLNV